MSEKTMRRRIVTALRALDALSIENPIVPGTPDVNYIEGWIELKWARRWPEQESDILRMPHFTNQQRVWLRRRWRKGGRVWLLLQVGQCWLLFDGATAADVVGTSTRRELFERAYQAWPDGLDERQLRNSLGGYVHPRVAKGE